MYKKIITIFITGFAVGTLLAQEQVISLAAADSLLEADYVFRGRPNIAVLPFYDANAQAKEVEFGRTVSAMLATALRSNTNFIVLERSEAQSARDRRVAGYIRPDARCYPLFQHTV